MNMPAQPEGSAAAASPADSPTGNPTDNPTGRNSPAFVSGLRDSLAVMVGYLPMAISFGLAAMQAGVQPWMAVLMSILMYAGAAQFIMVTLLAAGASAWTIITTVILMNLRHFFYGPSLLPQLTEGGRRWPLAALSAGLTDEVFATAMGSMRRVPVAQRETWYLGLQLGAYAAWVGGTALGAMLGHQISRQAQWLQTTLGFVLPALFFALLLELLEHSRWHVVLAAMLATGLLLLAVPAHWAMLGGMVAGGLACALYMPKAKARGAS